MTSIPKINQRFFCIVSRKEKLLAAVISSYLNAPSSYLSLFEFPEVEALKPDGEIPLDENYLMATRADEFGIRTLNALRRQGGCEYLILGCLTEQQKSFLPFLKDYNVLEINNVDEVDGMLSAIGGKIEYYMCQKTDVTAGLYIAASKNAMLKIDSTAGNEEPKVEYKTEGLILIEDEDSLSPIIAVNYAISLGAEVRIVSVPSVNIFEIKDLIVEWKVDKNQSALNEIGALLYSRIEGIEFIKFRFATFFTFGAPYSLLIKNLIPLSYVNTQLRPDFFVFNNLYIYSDKQIHSAVVFSPLEFGKDEETEFVVKTLEKQLVFVKTLIGKSATVYNIDYHVKEYPYEILHICSHGGEVSGYPVKLDFDDQDGNKHTVEYDLVISIAPTRGEKLIEVLHKYIFRKFDGLKWKSKELKSLNYPHYVYTNMTEAIRNTKMRYKGKLPSVGDSCSIKCSDFIYQAVFNSIAGHKRNPFVFNNTCWSWSGISDSFLSVGATGYIGTLWAVDNNVAVAFAEKFYNHAFDQTIIESFHNAMDTTKGTESEDIYVFWGLHFSFFAKGDSLDDSRTAIAANLLESFYYWLDRLGSVKDQKSAEQIHRLSNWNLDQLYENFFRETIKLVKPPIK